MPTPTRPEYKINGSDLHVTVPPGWFVTIASVSLFYCPPTSTSDTSFFSWGNLEISRESYNQVISITDDVYGEPNTAYIGSKYSKPPTAMKDLKSRNDSTAITAQGKQISLDLSFYYTTDKSLSRDLQKVATPNYRSRSIDILQVHILVPQPRFFLIWPNFSLLCRWISQIRPLQLSLIIRC